MPLLNREPSTSKDIPIWIKEQKQFPPPEIFLDVSEDDGGHAVGPPSQGNGLHCLDAKNRWDYHSLGSLISGARDNFLGKKAVLSFPMGKQRDNRPSHTVLQAKVRRSFGTGDKCQKGVPERKGQG